MSGGGSTVSSISGPISVTGTAGAGTSTGVEVSNGGSIISSASAPITVQTFSDLIVGANGSITSQGTGSVLLLAADNLNIESTGQVTTNTGNLTLVVDNKFPTFPNLGAGGFNLEAGAILSSGGELRIYTARRSQNSINELINGVPFVFGALGVDTATETWSTYFPDGVYGGLAFNIYYKEPIITNATLRQFYENIAANLTQLSDLLPILTVRRAPFAFPNYHFQVCGEERWKKWPNVKKRRDCSPDFSPYGSFIFEDAVWWITP